MMSNIMSIREIVGLGEIVICDSASAMQAHKELFRFPETAYLPVYDTERVSSGNIRDTFMILLHLLDVCNEAMTMPSRIHLVAGWVNMLRVAAWRQELIYVQDMLDTLKDAGMSDSELNQFTESHVDDLFLYLYSGKRLNIFKELCSMARMQIEAHINKRGVQAECHMIAADESRIFVSSL
jgi:hypothetical protein